MQFFSLQHLSWVLPLLILVGVALWYARKERHRALALLSHGGDGCHLKTNASPLRRRILSIALATSVLLACLASLRPISGTTISEFEKPAKNIILLVDVSKSMGASDTGGLTRMEAAKLLAREFVNRRPTDRIGLITFAGAPFAECPITLDRSALLRAFDLMEPGSVGIRGTDLELAFQAARKLLTEEPPPGSAVIIFSDGDNVTGNHQKVIAGFAQAQIPIFAVAFGDPGIPAPVPNSPYQTKAEFGKLREISQATDGIFLAGMPAAVDEQIAELSSRIDAIELSGSDIAPEIFDRPLDIYAYPLTAALLLLLLHLFLPLRSKKWHPLTAAIALLLFPPNLSFGQDYEVAREQAIKDKKPLLLIFTGSDWSPLSITFEEEILSHPVYQKWQKNTVIALGIDLPRTGIDPDQRRLNRELASKFQIASYPYAVFLEADNETELGRLTHDRKGPAEWVRRADAILAGNEAESDSAASIDYLPKEVREQLEDSSLTPAERSIGFYNKALELERANMELVLRSRDFNKLVIELYQRASDEAPTDRPDLAFEARLKLGILSHRKGDDLLPEDIENMAMEDQLRLAQEAQGDLIKLLKKIQRLYRDARQNYRSAAPYNPGDERLTKNLALIGRDLKRVKAYLDFQEAYQLAVETTMQALAQEKRFLKSLRHEVTSRKPINDQGVARSANAINKLIETGQAIEDKPTVLEEERFAEFKLALADIELAPPTHRDRFLGATVQHIQDALDHLIDPMEMQPQSGEGEGDPQPSENENQGDGDGDEENEAPAEPQGDIPDKREEPEGGEEATGDSDADLRRSEQESGDLRGRLLERLAREYRRRGGQDH